ncbi:hypothetical protein [Natrinema sp. HArc-T2]|uniref:hypothetical protein n=1 Tax=Natrinema sp. HArc-T2 TaxID=3242701 RepID=UPI00359E4851
MVDKGSRKAIQEVLQNTEGDFDDQEVSKDDLKRVYEKIKKSEKYNEKENRHDRGRNRVVNSRLSHSSQTEIVNRIDRVSDRIDKLHNGLDDLREDVYRLSHDRLDEIEKSISESNEEVVSVVNDFNSELGNQNEDFVNNLNKIDEDLNDQDEVLEEIRDNAGIHIEDIPSNVGVNLRVTFGLFFLILAAFQLTAPQQPLITKLATAASAGFLVDPFLRFLGNQI